MTFHVGQKVQCIHTFDKRPGEKDPVKGKVYTVRTVEFSETIDCHAIRLVEVVNQPRMYSEGLLEARFNAKRFIPLQETGMQILRSILANPKQSVDA